MKGYKVNIEPEEACNISEDIEVAEVPVRVIDNRDSKEYELVFYITVSGEEERCVRDKVRSICDKLGYTVWQRGEVTITRTEASYVFHKM